MDIKRKKRNQIVMIKMAICDDDISILNNICSLIDIYKVEHDREIVYSVFHSPLDLIAEVEKGLRVDILILDIIMPGENGINVAKEIRQFDSNVKIVFLTTSAEYAVQSYAVNAYYYQMKPILKEKFFELIDSAIMECEKISQKYIVLKCKNGITRINLDKLIYCEVIGRNLFFHMDDGKIFERIGSMEELCSQLIKYGNFVRPHRSFLVNMDYIQNISYKTITMNDSAEIPIPHGKYLDIKDHYLEYIFSRKQVFLS